MQHKSIRSIVAASLMLCSLTSVAAPPATRAGLISAPDFTQLMAWRPDAKTAALIFAAVSAYSLYSTIPVKEDTWNEKSSFNKKLFMDVSKIGTKEYWENIYNFWDKVWVGQCYKSKSIKLGGHGCDEEHRLQVHSEDCLAHGVCGNIDLRLKIIKKSSEGIGSLLLTYYLMRQYGVVGQIQQQLNAISNNIGNPVQQHNAEPRPVIVG